MIDSNIRGAAEYFREETGVWPRVLILSPLGEAKILRSLGVKRGPLLKFMGMDVVVEESMPHDRFTFRSPAA